MWAELAANVIDVRHSEDSVRPETHPKTQSLVFYCARAGLPVRFHTATCFVSELEHAHRDQKTKQCRTSNNKLTRRENYLVSRENPPRGFCHRSGHQARKHSARPNGPKQCSGHAITHVERGTGMCVHHGSHMILRLLWGVSTHRNHFYRMQCICA